MEIDEEGCLSIPELVAYVERPSKIVVEYQNLLGNFVKKELYGYDARVF